MLELDTAYIRAKFAHFSFSRSGDMAGAHQNLNGSRDLTTPLSWLVCHPGLELATFILPTKFDVSTLPVCPLRR